MRPQLLAALVVIAGSLLAPAARAYCRTTTCDPSLSDCAEDGAGCLRRGLDVFWGSSCITVSMQRDGAPNAGIDFAAAKRSVERAFSAWTGVACPGGGSPSLQVVVNGPVACAESEYSSDKHNANIVMFRDDVWPYAKASPDVLGFTRVRFDADTGELFDVDIEINAVTEPLSTSEVPSPGAVDLDSVIAHEVGHLLGLNHTRDLGATMVGGYQLGSTLLRDPASDDIAGICEIYPPGRRAASDSCEPRHGFSDLCAAEQPEDEPSDDPQDPAADRGVKAGGCSFSSPDVPTTGTGAAAAAALLALLGRRRRTRLGA